MKIYILEMAKSYLHLKAGQYKGLELDFLRLIYAVHRQSDENTKIEAHLMVANDRIKSTVEKWAEKYNASKLVNIHVAQIDEKLLKELKSEKQANAVGIYQGEGTEKSLATLGKELIEKALHDLLNEMYKEAQVMDASNQTVRAQTLFQIAWDYYGIIE